MNRFHRRLCSSSEWASFVGDSLLPFGLEGTELGPNVLEIGPGYGAATRILIQRTPQLTVLEFDPGLVEHLARSVSGVRIVQGDGTAMPFSTDQFSAVVCFTMLHHLPSAERQDRLFAEARRVLRPGGTFAGTDSLSSLRFRLFHIRDTIVPLDPAGLPARLERAGFASIDVGTRPHALRLRARATQ